MTKHKTLIKIDPGQACMVANIELFQHIIDVYTALSLEASRKEKESWLFIIDFIKDWVDRTYVPVENERNEFS